MAYPKEFFTPFTDKGEGFKKGDPRVIHSCTVVAPASTANLGPGFDVFGLGLDPLADRVKIVRGQWKKGRIAIRLVGTKGRAIPSKPELNTAGVVLQKMARDFGIDDDLDVFISKGVPMGSGLGSSAASAAASAIAFARLFELGIGKTELIRYAGEGEIASAGTRHYDNVAASLLGGFVIVREIPQLDFIRITPPDDLVLVVAIPQLKMPGRKTEYARSVLPKKVALKNVSQNISNATTLVTGLFRKSVDLIAMGIEDGIIEPVRSRLIPGYARVKARAIEAGALASTISGAGPSMIAILRTAEREKFVRRAMALGFKEVGLSCQTLTCWPSRGARIVATT